MQENGAADPLASARILVVDDEPGMRHFLVNLLAKICPQVDAAENAATAEKYLSHRQYDILLLDNIMPGQKGLDWLHQQRETGGITDTILITAYADLDTAITAMRAGASDFLVKPFRSNQILNAMRKCIELSRLKRENFLLKRELNAVSPTAAQRDLIGTSEAIAGIREMLERVAKLSTPVLISGPSGSGKEVSARYLHSISGHQGGPFVAVHCGSLPPELIESELFGGPTGSAREARHHKGLFASASGGTIFLEEIGDLPSGVQALLARLLEEGSLRTAGTDRNIPLDLRIVASSTRPLHDLVAQGRFREDLFFRLNVVTVKMPALKDRGEDIVALTWALVSEISKSLNLPPVDISAPVKAAMLRYRWPGNIRELRNFVERAVIFGSFPIENLGKAELLHDISPLKDVEKREILRAIEACRGNRSEAARLLGVSRKTIERKCGAWGIRTKSSKP